MARQIMTDYLVDSLVDLGLLNAGGGFKLGGEVGARAKAADYTIVSADDPSGTIFTNRGAAGEVIFTLPAPSQLLAGVFYLFAGLAGQNIKVKTATVDTLVTKNDAAADSVAMQTAGELIGGLMLAFCDGTSWYVVGLSVGHTFTVAT
jgi:hypothetical protein